MNKPVLLWLRRDLRLSDHWALDEAIRRGGPVIPVFIRDSAVDGLGAAPAWRLGLALDRFAQALGARGSRLILRSGAAADVLAGLVRETGAGAVVWTRGHDPVAVSQGAEVREALRKQGVEAQSCGGSLLFEPQTVATGAGGAYRVFTPFWKAVRGREVSGCLPEPAKIPAPEAWPGSDRLSDWHLGRAMRRGGQVVRPHARLGEASAQARLEAFMAEGIAHYGARRDLPGVDGTSGLSENLALGEISPHRCWHAGWRAMQAGAAGAETFLKELVWREFAYHLAFHTPHLLQGCWRPEWDGFAWQADSGHPHVVAWQRGRTGVPFVDAAMREMYVTGRMHNRARMIAASYLTKHLLTDWRIGRDWFADCLTDWDPASNAMGWQWVAGCGPDAAPYFRVFNPVTQQRKFDPDGDFVRRWIAEGQANPPETARAYFRAIPQSWGLSPDDPYPDPVVGLDQGRQRALRAYENRGF